MNEILIKNGTCILFEKENNQLKTVTKKLDIHIKNNIIYKLAPNIEISSDVKIIDATNMVIMPGLINMHTHVPMSIFRNTFEGCDLNTWLHEKIWPIEDTLTYDDIYNSSLISIGEAITTGTTLLNDDYFHTEAILKAVHDLPIRYTISRVLMDIDNKGDVRLEEFLKLKKNFPTKMMCIHGLYTCTEQYIKKITDLARAENLNVHLHFCEDANEVKTIINNYKVNTPTDVLKKYFKDINLILAHCVKVSNEDISTIKELNATVVHNPVSNLMLGCGIAPIYEMNKAGINICIGTDGQGSGNSLDMFEAMKFTALLQKGKLEQPNAISAENVIQMATINGAKALNLENEIGSIEENKKADLIVVDMSHLTLNPVNNIISNLVYNCTGRDVKYTIIDGKIMMEQGKINNINLNEIIKKAQNIISY